MSRAHFVKHAPCPQCNSKDNLALYSDGGGYCFGCGYLQRKTISGYVQENNNDSGQRPSVSWLVGEEIPRFSERVVRWINQYPESSVEELIRRRVTTVQGNPDSLLFQWFSEQGFPVLQQVRYFPPHPKRKYITYGKPVEVLPIYYAGQQNNNFSRRPRENLPTNAGMETSSRGNALQPKASWNQSTRKLVIVEDALSAIKMAHSVDSMPCLGSDIPLSKITALSRFYEEIMVWLDGNMFHKAVKMAERFSLLGLTARAVYTELDPKCYTHEQMREFVRGA